MNAQTGFTGSDGGQGAAPAPAPAAPAAGPGADGAMIAGELPAFSPDPSLGGQEGLILETLFGGPASDTQSSGQGAQSGQPGGGPNAGAVPPADGSPAAQGSGGVATPPATGTPPQQQGTQPNAQDAQPAPVELPAFVPPAGGQQQSPAAQQPPQAPPQAGQPQTGQSDLAMLQLRLNQLEAQNRHLQSLLTAPQGGQPAAGSQPGTQAQPGQPQIDPNLDPQRAELNLQTPQQVFAAIESEDPNQRMQGMNHLISGVATVVLRQALSAVNAIVDSRLQSFGADLEGRREDERIRNDYFGAFPGHNNPLFEPIIAEEMRAVYIAQPGLQWSPQARDAVGARVNNRLLQLGINPNALTAPIGSQQGFGPQTPTVPPVNNGQQGQVPPEAPAVSTFALTSAGRADGQATTSGRPAVMMDSGTRPPQQDQGSNLIMSTLGG